MELKPCPFCGGQAFIWNLGSAHGSRVSCENDCVSMPNRKDIWFTSENNAAEAWNTRTSLSIDDFKDAITHTKREDELKPLTYYIGSKPNGRALLMTTSGELRIGDWYKGVWRIDGDFKLLRDGKIESSYKEEDIEG